MPMTAPTGSAPTPSILHAALDASLAYGAFYPRHGLALSNHLPMVLQALAGLGADAVVLASRLQQARSVLQPVCADERDPSLTIERDLTERGTQAVLWALLPELMLRPESGAFHGMIRVGHALRSGHRAELARALSLWQSGRFALGPVLAQDAPEGPGRSLRDALASVAADPALAFQPRQGTTIVADLREAASLPGFARHLSGPMAPADAALGVDALAEASLAVYLASRDFTALHLVTGVHAWRELSACLPDAAAASPIGRRALWRAWLAAWISIGRPAPDWDAVHSGTAGESDWTAALPSLFAQGDDHAVKLAWSAREEWRHRRWPGYARVLGDRA